MKKPNIIMRTLTKAALSASLFSLSLTLHAAEPEANTNCPAFLDHEFKKLHSTKQFNLCEAYNGKPLLIVNTASHCGYTKQFGGLEKLYQKYKTEGFQVVGFASDDFKQAAKSEMEAATICYKNYGVTFTMLAPTKVKGLEANAVFQHLNAETSAPEWNFNKFLITKSGQSIQKFTSDAVPLGAELEKAVQESL